MHENGINVIKNLEPLHNLKLLYLQKNKIKKIQGLESLLQLKKLYLGCNEISVIEGLENFTNLEELHIENQRLSKGEHLCFDPRSVIKLSVNNYFSSTNRNIIYNYFSFRIPYKY